MKETRKTCPKCHKEYKKGRSFNQHQKHCGQRFKCPHCLQTYENPSSLGKHVRNLHPDSQLNRGRPVSYIPEPLYGAQEIPHTSKRAAEEVLIEPSPKKLILEDTIIPPPIEFSDLIVPPPPEFDEEPMECSEEEDYFSSQEEGDTLCNEAMDRMEEPPCWAQYPGISEEQFQTATQQMGGQLPLFTFEEASIVNDDWLNTVQQAVSRVQLKQQRDSDETDNIGVAIANALTATIKEQLRKMKAEPHHKVLINITAHGFEHAYQSVTFQVHEFTDGSSRINDLMHKLAGKLNSNESFHPDQGFQLDVTLVRSPTPGSGRKEKSLNPGRTDSKLFGATKKSIITIKNSDELCCARAIVTMQAHSEWKVSEKQLKEEQEKEDPDQALLEHLQREEKWVKQHYEKLRDAKGKNTAQLKWAQDLHRKAGVPEGPCGIPELIKFQDYLYTLTPPYQLKVFQPNIMQKPVFMGKQKVEEDHILLLIKSSDHYDGCTSLPGFLNRSYWCHDCDRAFNTNDRAHHTCQGRVCQCCNSKPCPDKTPSKSPTLECPDCYGLFYGPTCFQAHKDTALCMKNKHCKKCCAEYQVIQGKPPHRCGVTKCRNCQKYVNIREHQCFIQPIKEVDPANEMEEELDPTEELEETLAEALPPLFVYADIETMTLPDKSFEVNLLCYQTSEEEEESLTGENICQQFIHKLNQLARVPVGKKKTRERPVIVIFHNLKGFDGNFLISTLYKDLAMKVEQQFTTGAKVLCFQSGPLTFKDSLCFLPMTLDAFTKTFDLKEQKKGYFPHTFNTPENQTYKGPMPDKSYYDPEGMKETKKKEFDLWYAKQVQDNVQFNFQKELKAYCESDVKLLKGGCEAFAREFEEQNGFNPFEKSMTIAAACLLSWRRSDAFPTDKIAVRPLCGWRGAQVNQSFEALQWLMYCESLIPKQGACADRIKHVRNGGEQSVPTENRECSVDGYDPVTKTVYEFHGCLWHGCPTCYPTKRDMKRRIMPDRSANEAYRATLKKAEALKKAGYHLKEMWECEWNKQVKDDPQVKAFVKQLQWVEPIDPRDAFFGGRTGAVTLHDQVEGEEEILYVDVTSLYPWVNKTQEYPLGHPEIITQPDQPLEEYFGLAKVDILPPADLYHPVLPVREGGKLTFPLCHACVIENQAKQDMLERVSICHHTDAQRMLRGTWCTPEIQKAVDVGYTLIQIHEVWHFKERKAGLFEDYVNKWLKIKTEANGWPRHCTTEEQKQVYLDEYQEKEGITLDRDQIESNPGRKQTAKLMLNSFWGKFGQRENLTKTQQCTTPAELYNLSEDPTIEVHDYRLFGDVLEVVYKSTKEAVVPSDQTNVFIAAFTTCWARLKLYTHLEALQHQVLYYDTDSVIYKWAPGLHKVPTGDLLGEMKDELDGDIIEEFVSGGAKNYGYKTKSGKYECKVRGFTLNVRGKEKLNYHSMKEHILSEIDNPLKEKRTIPLTNPKYFKRDVRKDKTIRLTERTKRYGLVFDKRVLNPDTKKSEPYGYKRVRDEVDLLIEL